MTTPATMPPRDGSTGAGWLEVSPARPYPKCGKPDWCRLSADGAWCCCRRLDDGTGQRKVDRAGADYWLYRLAPRPAASGAWDAPRFSVTEGGGRRADPDDLHQVYTELLRHLRLSPTHVQALKARGLPAVLFDKAGYRTLGKGRATAAYAVVRAGLESLLPRVPGFFVRHKPDGSRHWTVGGPGGLLVPVRDARGRVVALLVRADPGVPGPKYHYLSSRKHGGAGPGSPAHVPLFEGPTDTVRVTEGALKADVATALSGLLTVGLPGVSAWRRAAPVLRERGATTARLAFDADARTNRTVARCLGELALHLSAEGFAVELEVWDAAAGKGIDDLLAAGGQPVVLTGDAAQDAARQILEAALAADPPASTPAPAEGPTAAVTHEAPDDPHRLARLWLRQCAAHPDGDRVVYYREQFWFWGGRCWQAVPDAEMRGRLTGFCKAQLDRDCALALENWSGEGSPPKATKVTTGLVANVLQALAGDALLPEETPQPTWLGVGAPARNYLAVANGLLDMDALAASAGPALRPHTPRWFSPVCLPDAFDPAADCPRWRAFLGRNLGDAPDKARLLQQFAGYLLQPDTSLQRFLLMVGEGANGKSVVCAVLRALLGEGNVSCVPLELFGERFRLAGTIGKLANVVAEVGELDRVAEGQLKAFVSGDPIEVERKFKAPYTARPTARLVLATNNPPAFSDRSDGLWRRMLLLRFSVQIPEAERVAGMDSVEFWQQSGEMPGVLNWALAGLGELRRQGRFVVPAACQDEVERLRTESNPARRFLVENYQAGSGAIPTAELYAAYCEWCKQHGHHPLADVGLGREVRRRFPNVKKGHGTVREGRRPVYYGLERKPDLYEIEL
ncbi:MAG TPA: phage/plasmid primase, P4 family [Gemmataceae bacterium]|nr:phage/plasmid primase, P4 family [Gemmataceae bacterium]